MMTRMTGLYSFYVFRQNIKDKKTVTVDVRACVMNAGMSAHAENDIVTIG